MGIFGNRSKWEVRSESGTLMIVMPHAEADKLINSVVFDARAKKNKEGEDFYIFNSNAVLVTPTGTKIYIWEDYTLKQRGQI